MASRRGKRAGAASGSSRTSVHASARPAAPPAADSTRLSVRSCRTSRVRLPPSAARIVSSRWRAAPRESSRFAMFAQAISSTRATALARTRIAGRTVERQVVDERPRADDDGAAAAEEELRRRRPWHAAGGGRTFGFRLFRRRAGPQSSQRGEDDRAVRAALHRRGWRPESRTARAGSETPGRAARSRRWSAARRRSRACGRPWPDRRRIDRATPDRSAPRQAGRPRRPHPSTKKRPIAGVTRSRRNTDGETVAPCRREGSKPGCRTR